MSIYALLSKYLNYGDFAYDSWGCSSQRRCRDNDHRQRASPQCEYEHVSLGYPSVQPGMDSRDKHRAFPQCGCGHVSWGEHNWKWCRHSRDTDEAWLKRPSSLSLMYFLSYPGPPVGEAHRSQYKAQQSIIALWQVHRSQAHTYWLSRTLTKWNVQSCRCLSHQLNKDINQCFHKQIFGEKSYNSDVLCSTFFTKYRASDVGHLIPQMLHTQNWALAVVLIKK